MTQEDNDEITLVGSDRPAGQVPRRHWMPAALVDELDKPRPVVPVRLLGEDWCCFETARGHSGSSSDTALTGGLTFVSGA